MSQTTILSIGNSFSEDTTHYVHQMCKAAEEQVKVVNLYIPGCSLKKHWENIVDENKRYRYELNGFYYELAFPGEEAVSINEVLQEEKWDHIISQQASHDSGILSSYEPYAKKMYAYLKEKQPQARLWMQQTWAYEKDSTHEQFFRYQQDQEVMYRQLSSCYEKIAEKLDVPLIRTGKAVQQVRKTAAFDVETNGLSLCRDGFHLSYIYGRYLAALVWCQTLIGIDALQINYIPKTRFVPNYQPDEHTLTVIKECVSSLEWQ